MTIKPTCKAGVYLAVSVQALSLVAQTEVKPPRESWAAEARPVALGRTPGQVTLFDEDDILRSGARTLGAFLLRELPGQVQSQGGAGLASPIYLGGSRPQDTLILVDGMPLMDPGRLGQDLSEVPLLGVTRIEVITGSPGSGPSGQGGTIALFTGRPLKPGASGDLGGLGGNNGQGQSTVTPGFAWEGGYLRGGNQSAQEKQTLPTDRPYRQVTNFFGLGQTWGPAVLSLAWRGSYFGVPQPYQNNSDSTRTYNPARESSQRSDSGQLRLDWNLGPTLNVETILGMARFRHEEPKVGSALPTPFEGRQTRFQSVLHLVTGPRSGLSLRLEGQDTRQDGDVNPAVLGAVKGTQAAFGLDWHFEARPGLRLLGQARGTRDRQSLVLGGTDREVLSASGHSLRLGFNQELGAGLRLYGAGSVGRTAPQLLEQLRNGSVAGAAPLRMEQTTTLQLGLGWGQGNWYGRLESQQQTGKDLIAPSGTSFANRDQVRARGTDAALGWRTAKKLGVEAFLRAQEARDMNAPEGQQYRTLAAQRRPFSAHGLKGFMGWSQVQAELHYTQQGRQYSTYGEGTPAAATGLPPTVRPTRVVYRNIGTSTLVQVGRHWTFILRGENLLQPRTDPTQWANRLREGQDDAFVIDGYPAATPTYSVEARFRF
ncbi:MAG: TonB-dependent receptor plug domain-containing protein [Holophagaceae bacterium]|uniref:TonB-dependent receptor plug domain-containing protein n=1 Tax=Candidatus Geothrix skivensis TaxID=2954439 RepID=A0A9D7XK62_9BACT|nr:TonB-dependent receptor plug domain-containing protein [Candidatus Geothrix skivensis]